MSELVPLLNKIGVQNFLEFEAHAAPALSATDQGRIYYDPDSDGLLVSVNGGAYGGIADLTTAGVTATASELNKLSGATSTTAELNKTHGVTGSLVQAQEASFTETSGSGTYTGSLTIPAGATILDVVVAGVAVWNNAGTAAMIVGDVADDNGYFDAINLKATDLLAGESLSFANAGGKAGAYIANSQVSPQYSASARTLSGIITTSSTGGSTGRTRMICFYVLPVATTAAAKV